MKNKNIYIYFGEKDTALINKIFNDLRSFCPGKYAEPVEIYCNNATRESIYRFR
jgi:hypothetical protein